MVSLDYRVETGPYFVPGLRGASGAARRERVVLGRRAAATAGGGTLGLAAGAARQPLGAAHGAGPSGITSILGYFSRTLLDSNEICCMLNHQRRLTLLRPSAAPTATQLRVVVTLHVLLLQVEKVRLKNIQLRTMLKKLEHTTKLNDELATGPSRDTR